MRRSGATYIAPAPPRARLSLARFRSFCLAFLLLFTVLSTGAVDFITGSSQRALADEKDPNTIMEESKNAYGVKSGESSLESLEKQWRSKGVEDNENSFGYVIQRLFSMGYINNVEKGVVETKLFGPGPTKPEDGRVCHVNDPRAGTPLYHNCDVPNVTTEIAQSIVNLFAPMGFANSTVESAESAFGFGLPSSIPGGKDGKRGIVPLKASDRQVKYTALELFGYNVKYTTYRGEWDNIRVMSDARLLANFGLLDDIRLGATSVVNGVVGGVKNAADETIKGMTNGNFLQMLSGPFRGYFEGSAAASVLTILDTSDLNVINTYGWYRVDYGGTLYNGREVSTQELKASARRQIETILTGSVPDDAVLPPEYTALQAGPPRPKEIISKCVFNGKEYGAGTPAPGVSQKDCEEAAKAAATKATWTVDGNAKGETLKAWRAAQESVFAEGAKYGIKCELDVNSEADRLKRLDQFYTCWEDAWTKSAVNVVRKEQTKVNQSWFDSLMKLPALIKAFWQVKNQNFNAPWNRFVCTNAQGDDLDPGKFTYVYSEDGTLNPACKPIRPPVQNGFFGNGYADENAPGTDTRYQIFKNRDIIYSIFSLESFDDAISNLFLGTTVFVTKVSNTILDLSFQPIFKQLGLTDKIVKYVEAFRDSIYFPLVLLVIGFSVVYILMTTARQKNYTKGFKDLLLIFLAFLLSTTALFAPKTLMTIVDEWPAYIETAIAGTIFHTGNSQNDALCSASQVSNVTPGKGLNNEDLPYSPRAVIRTMNCQVWRVYVFEPYVAGQWGTSYSNLYDATAPAAAGGHLKNTNQSLVGTGAVDMGGGITINNWGLYQLDVMTTGTSTTGDPTAATGYVPRDLYRIVDLQAGPRNGAGRDGRYLAAWSGQEMGARQLASFLAIISSIVGLLVIGALGLAKLQLTFMAILMLLFMPFVLLFAVHPTFGRTRVIGYVGTIVSLMVQRVMLVAYLAIMLRILTELALTATDYALMGLAATGIGLAFFLNRKPFMNLVKSTANSNFRANFAQNFINNPTSSVRNFVPRSAGHQMQRQRAGLKGAAAGAVGGYMVGGAEGARKGILSGRDAAMSKVDLRARRRGRMGALFGIDRGIDAARDNARQEAKKRMQELRGVSRDNVYSKTQSRVNSMYLDRLDKDDPAYEKKAKKFVRIDLDKQSNLSDLQRLDRTQKKIAGLEEEIHKHRNLYKPVHHDRETRDEFVQRHEEWVERDKALLQQMALLQARENEIMERIFGRALASIEGDPHMNQVKEDLAAMKDDFVGSLEGARDAFQHGVEHTTLVAAEKAGRGYAHLEERGEKRFEDNAYVPVVRRIHTFDNASEEGPSLEDEEVETFFQDDDAEDPPRGEPEEERHEGGKREEKP